MEGLRSLEEQGKKHIYTIDDIARELGISKTTVSRAISGKGRLSTETRAKVLDFIEKHNYKPNAVAKSLAHSRSFNIGLVLPGDRNSMDVAFFQQCTLGICEIASQNDYDILVTMENEQSTGQMQRIIDNHKVDGVIAARSEVDSPVISLLRAQKLPFIIIGSTSEADILHVDNNNREACRDLIAVLISRGVKRMALFGGAEHYCVTHSRLAGFQDACGQFGLSMQEQLVFRDLTDSSRVAEAVEESLRQKADCIICMDDFLCNLALILLREKKVHVPEDVKVASFYDDRLLEHTMPPITSLRFDAAELGRTACRELLKLLRGEEAVSRILPGYQIILRDSTN